MSDFLRRMRIRILDEEVFRRLTEFPSRYRSYVISVALRKFFQTDFSHDLLNVVLRKGKKKNSKTRGDTYGKPRKEKNVSSQTTISTEEVVADMESDIEKYLGLGTFRE
ncbi:MAG: hypothetical protein Q7J27_00825 [Syntrophales bacterium]|nr:hypothetical protein [Syntrophales bacterium]